MIECGCTCVCVCVCVCVCMLCSVKTDKASGSDGIPPIFLKEFADELAPVVCCLFRLILISCSYPSS